MIDFGNTLRKAREAQGLTISQLAAKTRLTPQVISALENEDFSAIIAPIYGRGFVKIYCENVGLADSQPLVREFMSIYNGERPKSAELLVPPNAPAPDDGPAVAPPVLPETEPPPSEPAAGPASPAGPEPVAQRVAETPAPDVPSASRTYPEPTDKTPDEPADETPGIASAPFRDEDPFAEPAKPAAGETAGDAQAGSFATIDASSFGTGDDSLVRHVPHPHPSANNGDAPVEPDTPPRRYVPPHPRSQQVSSPIPWRIVLLVLLGLTLLWVLVAGIRTLCRAASGTSADAANTSEELPPTSSPRADESCAPVRTQQEIPPLYID